MLEKSFRENFSTNLKACMDTVKMSQRELARRLGISNSTVSRWLSGDTKSLKSGMLFGICDVFSRDPAWFCEAHNQ